MMSSHQAPWPTPLMTSGARYSSVPTKLFARPSGTATSVTGSGATFFLYAPQLPSACPSACTCQQGSFLAAR